MDSQGNPVAGSGPSGTVNMPNGGSFSYTSTVTVNASGNGYVTLNANFATLPGSHTIGAVQTDGPCTTDQYGRKLCIANTDGFVLAEGKTTVDLNAGSNAATALFLRGVVQSAFLCDAACDGQVGTADSNGVYHLTAYAADESGQTIYQQSDTNGNIVPLANGPVQIVETDNNGIVTLGGASGPESAPGSDNAHGPYGYNFSIKCAKVGTTTVTPWSLAPARLQRAPLTASRTRRATTRSRKAIRSSRSVGADEYFGNTLNVNCEADGLSS